MEQANQTTETDRARLAGEFYYTLALVQTQAIRYVAGGKTDDDKVVRAKTVIEQVKEIIKSVEEAGVEAPCAGVPQTACDPPCYWDNMWCMCICPKIHDSKN